MPIVFRCLLTTLLCLPAAATRAQDLYAEGVVRTLELTFVESNWAQILTQNYASKTFLKAKLKVGDVTYPDVGVRYRGNSSYNSIGSSPKKPFEISMDAFVPGQKLYGYRTLNLNNGFRDPTFVREVLCYWIYRQLMPAPKANYVKLVINSESWGPYVNVQQVNKDLQEEWFRDASGNRYRAERQTGSGANDSALVWLGSVPDSYKRGYELKTENAANPWVDVMRLCDVLNNTPVAQLTAELPKVLDDDLALRYCAGNAVVPALDSYVGNQAHNYYLVGDAYHGRFAIVPWDLNAAFGANNWLTVQQKTLLDPYYQSTNAGRPLVLRMLGQPVWKQRYLAHVRTLLDQVYDWQQLAPRVAALQKLVEPELALDAKRLYSMQLFRDNVGKDVQIQVNLALQWIPGLEPLVRGRSAFLRAHTDVAQPAPSVSALQRAPLVPTVRDAVTVTARVSGAAAARVTLFHRVRGPWLEAPMFDDGQHGDGQASDGVWGGAIAAQPYGTTVEYYVGAETAAGALTFEPRSAGHRPPAYAVAWPRRASPLRINEFLAKNDTGRRDEKNELEDWLEIYNAGQQEMPVSGLFLTDDLSQPTKWQVPAGHSLRPGQTLLVWADDEPQDGPLHATFKLDVEGEALALFDTDGTTLLDVVEFDEQRGDESAGRLFDGSGPWVTFPLHQTPGALNATPSCGRRYYSALEPLTHRVTLRATGTVRIGSEETWLVGQGPASSAVIALLCGAGTNVPLSGHAVSLLLADPLLLVLPLPTDAQGSASLRFQLPDDARLVGARLYVGLLAPDPSGLLASNALETTFCAK